MNDYFIKTNLLEIVRLLIIYLFVGEISKFDLFRLALALILVFKCVLLD